MTNLTIELAPELYERLQHEAQRQGKAEQTLAQEILAGQLRESTPTEMPLYVHMLPQIRALVAGKALEDFVVAGEATPQEAIALLHSWAEEDTQEDDEGDESWEDVLRAIDVSRFSYRKLFPDLERPQ
jgi:hypothetical protein